jgi:hypothetical protein
MNAVILTVLLMAGPVFIPWGTGYLMVQYVLKRLRGDGAPLWLIGMLSLMVLFVIGMIIYGMYNLSLWLLS